MHEADVVTVYDRNIAWSQTQLWNEVPMTSDELASRSKQRADERFDAIVNDLEALMRSSEPFSVADSCVLITA
jgi:hypothetical protein